MKCNECIEQMSAHFHCKTEFKRIAFELIGVKEFSNLTEFTYDLLGKLRLSSKYAHWYEDVHSVLVDTILPNFMYGKKYDSSITIEQFLNDIIANATTFFVEIDKNHYKIDPFSHDFTESFCVNGVWQTKSFIVDLLTNENAVISTINGGEVNVVKFAKDN